MLVQGAVLSTFMSLLVQGVVLSTFMSLLVQGAVLSTFMPHYVLILLYIFFKKKG
jgi:hypothetical protein